MIGYLQIIEIDNGSFTLNIHFSEFVFFKEPICKIRGDWYVTRIKELLSKVLEGEFIFNFFSGVQLIKSCSGKNIFIIVDYIKNLELNFDKRLNYAESCYFTLRITHDILQTNHYVQFSICLIDEHETIVRGEIKIKKEDFTIEKFKELISN